MGQIARTHVCCRVAEGEFSVDALVEDKTQLIGGPATSRKPGNLMEILSAIVGNEAKKVFRNTLRATWSIINGKGECVSARLEEYVLRVLDSACPTGQQAQRATRCTTFGVGGRDGAAFITKEIGCPP